jgi:hypothetical protein
MVLGACQRAPLQAAAAVTAPVTPPRHYADHWPLDPLPRRREPHANPHRRRAAGPKPCAISPPGEPLTHGALTVIPLLAPGAPDPGWLTLAEAGDAVTIEEVSEAGAVPTLRLTSVADRPVLLLDGEELIGARQNRVLNTTVLVAAGARLTIPVSCVEEGRWAYRSRRFAVESATGARVPRRALGRPRPAALRRPLRARLAAPLRRPEACSFRP